MWCISIYPATDNQWILFRRKYSKSNKDANYLMLTAMLKVQSLRDVRAYMSHDAEYDYM